MSGAQFRSGGKRRGAGRFPQVFHISKKAARSLYVLTSLRQGLNPHLTELEVLEEVIDKAWKELDEAIERNAEIALEGEEEYLNAAKEA